MSTIYKGNNNVVSLILRQGSSAYSIKNYTKVELIIDNETIYDTDTNPTYFEFSNTRTGLLTLFLGQSNILVGEYEPEIIYYDADNINGISFGTFYLEVK